MRGKITDCHFERGTRRNYLLSAAKNLVHYAMLTAYPLNKISRRPISQACPCSLEMTWCVKTKGHKEKIFVAFVKIFVSFVINLTVSFQEQVPGLSPVPVPMPAGLLGPGVAALMLLPLRGVVHHGGSCSS
jgi:hypothetical protein